MVPGPKRPSDASGGPPARIDEDPPRVASEQTRRAAAGLEELGELRAAARLFDYVGEHGQAAALRLEYAATLRAPDERLSILREGAARVRGKGPESRRLHRALAEALVDAATVEPPGVRRRALILEAARSWEASGEGLRAGRIYEELGLLERAEAAYRDAGAIEAYESVLEALDARRERDESLRALEREIEEAWAEGARALAAALLEDLARPTPTERPELALLRRRHLSLMEARPRRDRVLLRVDGRKLSLVLAPVLRIGRAPHCELRLSHPSVSREHLRMRPTSTAGVASVAVEDLATRGGSFADGEPLLPDEPIELHPGDALELGAALAPSLHCRALPGATPRVLIEAPAPAPACLYLPAGGPLDSLERALGLGAGLAGLSVDGESEGGFVRLRGDASAGLHLNGRPLGARAAVDLLVGDRIESRGCAIEVLA